MYKDNELDEIIDDVNCVEKQDEDIDEIDSDKALNEHGEEVTKEFGIDKRNEKPKTSKLSMKGSFPAIYRLLMLVIGATTLVLVLCILIKVSNLQTSQDTMVIEELDNKLVENKEDDVSEGVLDTGAINDGDLKLEDIQNMDSNTIIDTYLISKTNARRHNYDMSNLVQDEIFWLYKENGKATSKIGVDVSSYQGDIDWKKVKAAGVDFAIVRVGIRGYGSGKLVEDEKFKSNMEGAIGAGLDVGVYFFSQSVTEEEAVEEAKFVCDLIKKYDVKYPVAYDSEKVSSASARTNKAKLSANERTDMAIAFCDYVKSRGYEACIYSNKRWFLRYLNLEKLDDYGIWLAQYSSDLSFPFHFGMWQYTDKGKVDGIDGNVDIDIYFDGDNW